MSRRFFYILSKMQKFFTKKFFLPLSVFLFFSCVTMADYDFSSIDRFVKTGKFLEAQGALENEAGYIYSDRDTLLFNLDTGILNHFAGEFNESNYKLSLAEKLCAEYSADSFFQSVASAVTNDNVKDYSGEAFEDIYTNIFMALNYIHLGKIEDGMVEVRRFDNKLKLLQQKYETLCKNTDSESDVKVKKVSIQFSDSALARYLSLLLYRTEGDLGNAEVDYKFIYKAFEKQKSLYDFPVPSCVKDELSVPADKGRLNVLVFTGNAPVKKEEVIRAYWSSDVWYKLALPVMEKRSSYITSVRVKATNLKSNSTFYFPAEKIESIENIAVDTFRQKKSVIYAKALARSIARSVSNTFINTMAENAQKSDDSSVALFFTLLDITSKVTTEVVERADVRSSRYFPSEASVAGFNLEKGDYSVTVEYFHGSRVVFSESKNISVRPKSLNLVESVCLR